MRMILAILLIAAFSYAAGASPYSHQEAAVCAHDGTIAPDQLLKAIHIQERKNLGFRVIMFLSIFALIMYRVKKEKWKDVS